MALLRPLSLFLRPSISPLILLLVTSTTICLLISGIFAGEKKKGKNGGGDGGGLSELLGGLDLDGMLSGMQELLGNADGQNGKGLDKLKQMAANLDPKMLKDVLGKIDTEKIGDTLKNMVTPENIWEMIPANVKEVLPESWFFIGKKVGNVLSKEWDKVSQLVDQMDKVSSAEELWEMVKQQTPILADLLENDLWKGSKGRWEKFEGNLDEEAKRYTENVKTTGWEWLSRKVFAPALHLSPEAKRILKDSAGETFPTVKPLLEKAAANEKLKEWADQWQMMAELEAMFAQFQSATEGLSGANGRGKEEEEAQYNRTETEQPQQDEMEKEEL